MVAILQIVLSEIAEKFGGVWSTLSGVGSIPRQPESMRLPKLAANSVAKPRKNAFSIRLGHPYSNTALFYMIYMKIKLLVDTIKKNPVT